MAFQIVDLDSMYLLKIVGAAFEENPQPHPVVLVVSCLIMANIINQYIKVQKKLKNKALRSSQEETPL